MDLITFQCSSCQHTLRIGADKAGRKARCTKCGAELVIPSASPPSKPVPVPAADDDDEYTGGGIYGFAEDASKPPSADSGKSSALKKRSAEDDDEEDDDEEDRPMGGGPSVPAEELKKDRPKRKITRQRKLLNPEKWQKVQIGFRIVSVGFWIWLGALLLQKAPSVIGYFSFLLGGSGPSYADLAMRYTAGLDAPSSAKALDRAEFLMGMVAGAGNLETGLWLARIGQILAVIHGLVFLVGYGFCLAVPPRFGSRGLVITLLSIGSLNLILGIVFKLLPLTGAWSFAPTFLVAPEIVIHPSNTERLIPLNIFWSDAPFGEMLLTIVILSLFYFEPVVFCMFMRAVACAMKDELLESKTRSLMTLGLSQIFAQLAYQMLSITGTSDVLQGTLRIVYLVGAGFLIGQLIWFALMFNRMPDLIEKEVGEGSALEGIFDQDEEEDDEEDEEGEDEDEDEDEDE